MTHGMYRNVFAHAVAQGFVVFERITRNLRIYCNPRYWSVLKRLSFRILATSIPPCHWQAQQLQPHPSLVRDIAEIQPIALPAEVVGGSTRPVVCGGHGDARVCCWMARAAPLSWRWAFWLRTRRACVFVARVAARSCVALGHGDALSSCWRLGRRSRVQVVVVATSSCLVGA